MGRYEAIEFKSLGVIPVPTHGAGPGVNSPFRDAIRAMDIGECLEVGINAKLVTAKLGFIRGRGADGKKFVVRTVTNNSSRVWRIA